MLVKGATEVDLSCSFYYVTQYKLIFYGVFLGAYKVDLGDPIGANGMHYGGYALILFFHSKRRDV